MKRKTKERGKVIRPIVRMKKRIVSAVLSAVLVITSAMPAFATPNQEVIENQQKYDELTEKINQINDKIYALEGEIEPLVVTIENNNAQMEQIKVEVKNTEKEIETAKEEIAKTEEVLGKRVRELYKSGGQSSYIMLLFSADSFNDLITKIESTNRLVNIDKKIVKDLNEKQETLNNKVKSLDEKGKELTKINEETQKSLSEFETKKKEQEVLVEQVKAEQAVFERDYLAVSERMLVTPQFNIIDNSSSSMDSLNSAISQLRSIRDNQIKSSIVKEEINTKIEKAKAKVEQMKAQIEAEQEATNKPANKPNRGDTTVSATGNAVVDYAYKFLGLPYKWGATGPNSFDCSGFTQYVYKNAAGINISRTTGTQINAGRPVSRSEMQPGDLIFTHAGHVGIYVGGNKFIHAPRTGDVIKVSNVYAFYAARRVL